MARLRNKVKGGGLKFKSIHQKSLLLDGGEQRIPFTVPGGRGSVQTSGLISRASQREKKPLPIGSREKFRAIGFIEGQGKPKSRESASMVIESATTKTVQNQMSLLQKDAPYGDHNPDRSKEKQAPNIGEDFKGVGSNKVPKYLPLTGSGSGNRTGRKSRLDCGDESAQDFRNSPEGYKCCLKSAKCFENLPEDIEEVTDATKQNGDPKAGNFSEACGQIDDSLVCMAGVLAKNQCKNAAEIVNKDLSEELVMVQEFHRKHCSGTLAGRTTLSPIPGGQGHSASSGSESGLPTSVVIGAAIGGLFLIILIVAIVCFARRKKSRPPTQDMVAFRNSSAESARYKEFFRSSSEVYAEIDEKHLQRSLRANNDNTTFERVEGNGGSTGSRPLPTAPSNGVDEDRTGYLTPRDSRENINDKTGYDQLSTVSVDDVSSAGSYDKLARAHRNENPEPEVVDGDYITPESDKPTEEKNPDNYHTYFVLEK